MNIDPIAQQTILSAVRQTQTAKVARTEPPPSAPQESLEKTEAKEELNSIAKQCNKQESAAKGAERQVFKAAMAQFPTSQIGKKGVLVKVSDPPIEGKLMERFDGLDVGGKIKVELRRIDPNKGFIDFVGFQ